MHRAMIILLLLLAFTASAELEIPEGMVLVPGARFAMGVSQLELEDLAQLGKEVPHMDNHYRSWFLKEMPLHEVRVDSFFLDAKEVTNAQFALFVEETGYEAEGQWREHAGEGREEHPVVRVTWNDAQAYAAWTGGRLPSEAEWEWAARGGKDSRWFPWGESDDRYSLANYGHDRTFWGGVKGLLGFQRIATDEVGHFNANGYGLFDMSGNVAEWCADDLLPYPGAKEIGDPFRDEGYFDHPQKCVRGGSWNSPNPVFVRCNTRSGRSLEGDYWSVGFRCARSISRLRSW